MADSLNMQCNTQQEILYKGTTPNYNFSVCLDTSLLNLEEPHIVFTSGSGIVDKTNTDITVSTNLMSCSLLQDDTMSFTGNQVNIQILATMSNGQKVASIIMKMPVANTLYEGTEW